MELAASPQRACAVNRTSILALLDEPNALPPVPPVAQQVVRLSEDDNTHASALARVISNDPALAARLLRVANSAFFGFSRKVETVTLAVTLLGFRAVRNMVLALSLKSMFRSFGILERRLWAQSVCMGIGSSAAARRTHVASPEEAFVAGLLADSGQAVLLELLRGDYQGMLLTAYREDIDILELERERFGVGHDEIGAALARRWNLPESLEHTIRHHHGGAAAELDPHASGMAHVVQAAVLLARAIGAGRPAPAACHPDDVAARMGALGLDTFAFELLTEEVRARLLEEGSAFG